MSNLLVNVRDQRFVLHEQIGIERLFDLERYSDFSADVVDMMLTEAEKLAVEELAPAFDASDKTDAAFFEDGIAHAPRCFHAPFWKLRNDGWSCPHFPEEYGGQGIPTTVNTAIIELLGAANYPLLMYVNLTVGAAGLIMNYGTREQKERYLYKMAKGDWGGTMCLTEPGAGSDVGALRTMARRLPDGTYSITGTKCFISSGDHDLTENIIHMVLARIDGDPAGTGGISIFIVPKFRVNNDGKPGRFNDVVTGSLEHKMGIKGSATATLNFGDDAQCIGELLGEERAGMRIMFRMMNEARLETGMQGLSYASAALEHAVQYAKERVQGRDITGGSDAAHGGVPIIRHPDVRRSLLWMKSHVEGMRAMNYFIAFCIDMEKHAADADVRKKCKGYVELLTPVSKAYCSDKGFEVCSLAMDVYGGYGYCQDYPIEQYLRDVKIAAIYEGTNAIQAADLVGRKLRMSNGAYVTNMFSDMRDTIRRCKEDPALKGLVEMYDGAVSALENLVEQFSTWSNGAKFLLPILNARPFLMILGDAVVGWKLLDAAITAHGKIDSLSAAETDGSTEKILELGKDNSEVAFYLGKIASARYFSSNVLSTVEGRCRAIKLGDGTPLEVLEESLGA